MAGITLSALCDLGRLKFVLIRHPLSQDPHISTEENLTQEIPLTGRNKEGKLRESSKGGDPSIRMYRRAIEVTYTE